MTSGAALRFPQTQWLGAAQGGTGGSELTGIAGWAVDVVDALGAVGVGLMVALENLFPPIPSEVILPVAGYAAGQGRMNLIAAIAGSLLGALLLYWLGARFGRDRLRAWAQRIPLVEVKDLDHAEDWFGRHSGRAALIGRCVPVVRSLISIPAGIERLPLRKFVPYTVIGSGVWNSIFVLAGHQLGSRWQNVGTDSGVLNKIVLAVIAVLVITFVVRRWRDKKRDSRARDPIRLLILIHAVEAGAGPSFHAHRVRASGAEAAGIDRAVARSRRLTDRHSAGRAHTSSRLTRPTYTAGCWP